MEVTVIDDSGTAGFVWSAAHEGEIYMEDVDSMVRNVLLHVRPYHCPYIFDGTPGNNEIRCEWMIADNMRIRSCLFGPP